MQAAGDGSIQPHRGRNRYITVLQKHILLFDVQYSRGVSRIY